MSPSPPTYARFVLIGAFALAVRLISAPEIGTGGDAILKWWNGKILLGHMPGTWEWSHHTARIGVMAPTLAVQALLGSHPSLYYLPTLTVSLVQSLLLLTVATRLVGPAWAFWVTVALVAHPQMTISGAQLLPGVYSSTYLLGCIYCWLRHHDAPEDSPGWVVAAAGCFFLAYLTKLSNGLYVPGLAIAIVLWQRRSSHLFLFGAIVAALVALEFGLYRGLAGTDRLEILEEAGTIRPVAGWLSLLDRYRHLGGPWSLTLGTTVAALVALGVVARRVPLERTSLGIVALCVSFLVGITFSVRGIDPVIPAQAFFPRYFTSALPLFLLAIALGAKHVGEALSSRPQPWPRDTRSIAATLITIALLVAWLRLPALDRHPIVRTFTDAWSVDAFEAGVPIISFDGRGWAARSWLILYWNESERPIRTVRVGREGLRGYSYAVVRDGSAADLALQTVSFDDRAIAVVADPIPHSDSLGFRLVSFTFDEELRRRVIEGD